MPCQTPTLLPSSNVPLVQVVLDVKEGGASVRGNRQAGRTSGKFVPADFLAGFQVPRAQGKIVTDRQNRAPVGVEHHVFYRVGMPFEAADGFPGGHVP